jgi:excisionase family DNA binding protein
MLRKRRLASMDNYSDYFLDVDEVCDFLRIKKSWLYQNHKLSGMPSHNVGRKLLFKRSELVAWVLEQ